MNRCLYCYQLLSDNQTDFHPACSQKIFGTKVPPVLPYAETDIETLALTVIRSQTTVTGAQPKLSLHLEQGQTPKQPLRFTIMGLWGDFILKPPTLHYPELPEIEDLTLYLAQIAKINTVPHTLIRLESGSLAYLTRRIDRNNNQKYLMEDFCQLTEKMTEQKYQGSYEKVAKAIMKYSDYPLLDVVNFWEQVLFSFLTGNADMHLKNFSLLHLPDKGYHLAPAYDLVATALVNPEDQEELALTLNAKKRKITRQDFIQAFNASHLTAKQQANLFQKMERALPKWSEQIKISFLSVENQQKYQELIIKNWERLNI
jgi:serine/threonine-protein kinase HipA